MLEYTISVENSPKEFRKTCREIEEAYPEAVKKKLLIDVDGSTVQSYLVDGKKIVVLDDYDFGIVFVKTEFEIPIFKDKQSFFFSP